VTQETLHLLAAISFAMALGGAVMTVFFAHRSLQALDRVDEAMKAERRINDKMVVLMVDEIEALNNVIGHLDTANQFPDLHTLDDRLKKLRSDRQPAQ
jgi:hypothetical protein